MELMLHGVPPFGLMHVFQFVESTEEYFGFNLSRDFPPVPPQVALYSKESIALPRESRRTILSPVFDKDGNDVIRTL
jgi:hypothetical protein